MKGGSVDRRPANLRPNTSEGAAGQKPEHRMGPMVRPEYRLSSYGPSLDLVREVCARGRWEDRPDFLRVWEKTWDHPRLRESIATVMERRLPSND